MTLERFVEKYDEELCRLTEKKYNGGLTLLEAKRQFYLTARLEFLLNEQETKEHKQAMRSLMEVKAWLKRNRKK